MSLEENFERLEHKVDHLTETCSFVVPTTKKLDREVFGNGRPGLSAQMATVQATQKLALKVLGSIGLAGLALLGSILLKLL